MCFVLTGRSVTAMDEVLWSCVVHALAAVPWIAYFFAIIFFTISILYG